MAGLEPVLAEELKAIGAEDVQELSRAVKYSGDKVLMYLSNLKCATALRILVPILDFEIRSQDDFYRFLLRQDWTQWMDLQTTFAIDAAVKSDHFRHTHYPALKMKDAIADFFSKKFGKRPSVNLDKPKLRLNLFISGDKVSVSLDSSGYSLHKRGFRTQQSRAPINEVLAAGILRLTGWNGSVPLLDPMCGSGTFLQEAALFYTNTPPGLKKQYFGFFSWKDFDPKLWERVKVMATQEVRPLPKGLVTGTDVDRDQIEAAEENLKAMGFDEQVVLKQVSFSDLQKSVRPEKSGSARVGTVRPVEKGMIVMNPPYGERIRPNDILDLYKEMGDKLKKDFGGWNAWILSSNLEALKNIGLKTSKRINLFNGPLLCSLREYQLYRGSRKEKAN